jgi:signal transduction histidine kinase
VEAGDMRLAVKMSLANSIVILILLAVAVFAIAAVTELSIAHRAITVRTAEALRLEVAAREAVTRAHQLDLRSLVFADPAYASASNAEATRITEALERLRGLLTTDAEQGTLETAISGFGEYRAVVERARELLGRRAASSDAETLLSREGTALVERVVAALDHLGRLTQEALDRTQIDATVELGRARTALDELRIRTWTAVPIALGLALLAAVAGTAVISVRMTRSLRRLSAATRTVAAGEFTEPVPLETNDEIGELARSFNTMAARLREVDGLKQQFYATMSHELRSPLMSIRASAEIIASGRAGPITERQQQLLAIIHRGGDRVLSLVNEVLDLSRARAGLLPLDRQRFDLDGAVARAVEELRPQAVQSGIVLRLQRSVGTVSILGDEGRIVQVVINLVANALRFTPAGGSVSARVTATDAEALLEVEDTGIGIRSDLLPVVFERFRQAHEGHGGTGLGLALVRAIVEAHGGRVTVESQEGKGSRFTVILPRARAEEDAHA